MVREEEVAKFICMRYLNTVIYGLYPETSGLREQQRREHLERGWIAIEDVPRLNSVKYGIKDIPYLSEDREIDAAARERIFQKGEEQRQRLVLEVSKFPVPFNDIWMVADAIH